jgi:septal ring factor EnvC (AmiA/AmiB activator)
MPRSLKALGFVLVLMVGIWGCAKGPASASNDAATATAAKLKQVEEEYRAAQAARDQFRVKLAASEELQAKTAAELTLTRIKAEKLTTERDALNAQYDAFRKNLKELLGSADSAVSALGLPAPTVTLVAAQPPALAPSPREPLPSLSDQVK